MRQFFGIILILLGAIFSFGCFALLVSASEAAHVIIAFVVFLLPAIAFWWLGIKQLKGKPVPNPAYNAQNNPFRNPSNGYNGGPQGGRYQPSAGNLQNQGQQSVRITNGNQGQQIDINWNTQFSSFNPNSSGGAGGTFDTSTFSTDNNRRQEQANPPKPTAAQCPGCGANVKFEGNVSAVCDYCGTTVRFS